MNDYWNDPPESPDPPRCPNHVKGCDGDGEYLHDGETGCVFRCSECGHQWVEPYPQEPQEDPIPEQWLSKPDDLYEKACPHGDKTGLCEACMFESDLQYDASRERRR